MIQTKEELFLAELGINTKEKIELAYGAKIKITDLLKKYETQQLLIHSVVVPKGTLCDLNGKKVMVKFKVTKYIPKIFIEDI
jgi:hypothetical protein